MLKSIGDQFPIDLFYSIEDGIWIRLYEDNNATIGITAITQARFGKFRTFKFKPKNTVIQRAKNFVTVETMKYYGYIRSPVSFLIKDYNSELNELPTIINTDPYGKGWILKVKILDSEFDKLLLPGREAQKHFKQVVDEKGIVFYPIPPDHTVNGIGIVCPGPISSLIQGISHIKSGEILAVLSDDLDAEEDFNSWIRVNGHELIYLERKNKIVHVLVKKT